MAFSGPPKLRVRDPGASLDAVVDWAVIVQVIAWALIGLWACSRARRIHLLGRLSTIEKISIALALSLGVSISVSDAPGLTAFKVYQLLMTVLFAGVFVRIYGCKASLRAVFVSSAVLCIADVVAALVAPGMVFGESDFGSIRFTGELIAPTGVVGVYALLLLFSTVAKQSRLITIVAVVLFGSITLFSLMRTSYVAVFGYLLFVLWKAPEMQMLKRFAKWALLVLPLAAIGGVLANLEEYRSSESIWTLSDRLGLWAYLIDTMLKKSPWIGLGYFSASRLYGPEYNVGLGTAHSVLVEVLAGGGLICFGVFLAIWCLLFIYMIRLSRRPMTSTAFAMVGILLVTVLFVSIGSELEAAPAGLTFWIALSSLPILLKQQSDAQSRSKMAAVDATRLLGANREPKPAT